MYLCDIGNDLSNLEIQLITFLFLIVKQNHRLHRTLSTSPSVCSVPNGSYLIAYNYFLHIIEIPMCSAVAS